MIDKLSDILSDSQKWEVIKNLLQEMKRENTINIVRRSRWARWVLSKPDQDEKETEVRGLYPGDQVGDIRSTD